MQNEWSHEQRSIKVNKREDDKIFSRRECFCSRKMKKDEREKNASIFDSYFLFLTGIFHIIEIKKKKGRKEMEGWIEFLYDAFSK